MSLFQYDMQKHFRICRLKRGGIFKKLILLSYVVSHVSKVFLFRPFVIWAILYWILLAPNWIGPGFQELQMKMKHKELKSLD